MGNRMEEGTMKNVLEFKYHKIVEGYYDIRDNLTPRNLVPR